MFFAKTLVAAATFAASASAHMKLANPKPYGASTLNNSPLDGSGSDFPCKQRSGVYAVEGASNVYPLGSSQELRWTGSAVHGGGSCQIAITYDKEPTKSSVFRVIHSIQGGCPAKNTAGNLGDNANAAGPDGYPFTIPADIPAGNVTLSVSWFNKVGNREMYQFCSPVQLTGNSGTQASFDALPEMFVANIGSASSGCEVPANMDVEFPNPGKSVVFGNGESNPSLLSAAKLPAACGKAGNSNGGGSGAKPTSAASAPASAPAPSKTAIPGGVFITASLNTGAPAPTTTAAAPSTPVAVPTSVAAAPAPPAATGGAGAGAGAGSAAGALSGPCSPEGMWNCLGSSFQQCASGSWSVVQQMASGTKCTPGKSAQMAIAGVKRQIRAFRA